jgi:DNA (cytosine-5)-methyltransferase 1
MFTLTAQDKHGVMICDTKNSFGNPKYFDDISPTLLGSHYKEPLKLIENDSIRRLTPKECFRLQGWPDEYFEKAAAVNSDTQLYKQAGNGVTVNVIYEIAKRL